MWHTALIFNLKPMGIEGTLLKWFESYLENRMQCVVIDDETSEWGQIQAGVPQGSVFCPMFFLIYRKDITDNIQTHIKLFVYDLYIAFNEIDKATNQLNIDLDTITR